MKKLLLMMSVLLSLSFFCACSSDDEIINVPDGTVILIGDSGLPEDSLISQDHAWLIVKAFVLKNQLDRINVYVSQNTIQPKTLIKTLGRDEISPDYESWLFFIDDMPFGNWSHPCRYVYVNAVGGKYEVLQQSMPPMSMGELFTPLVQMPPELIGTFNLKNSVY